MLRCLTCGSSNTRSNVLIGAQGTLATLRTCSQWSVECIEINAASCGIKHATILDTCRIRREARVHGDIRTTGQSAQPVELPIIANSKNDVSVGSWKRLVGHDIWMSVPDPRWDLSRSEIVQGLVGQSGNLNVEQRWIDVLPLTSASSVLERGKHRN